MRRILTLFTIVLSTIILFSSCEKDDPKIPNGGEVITNLEYTLMPFTSGETVVLTFSDVDGDGGNEPIVIGGTLKPNTFYRGRLTLSNTSVSPPENITTEVENEANEHQFFFTIEDADCSISYDDDDSNGNPVGLRSVLTTSDVSSGELTIILRHMPIKDGVGVSEGDITNAGGDTDIEVTFPIDIQ